MLPRAEVRHSIPGRVRVVLPDRQGDAGYFGDLELRIRGIPGVTFARGNPVAASLTVEYHGKPESLMKAAEDAGLFKLQVLGARERKPSPHDSLRSKLAALIGALDRDVGKASSGEFDLGVLGFLTLSGLAFWQLRRGKFLPAGLTLLMQAGAMLEGRSQPIEMED